MAVDVKYQGPTDMFRWTQPETHLHWMGVTGYVESLLNIDAAMGMGSRSCLMTLGMMTWPFSIVWTVSALSILLKVPYLRAHRWFRIGLVAGIGTWCTPLVFIFWK